MKVFVTGVCGQLGYDTVNELNKRGFTAVGSDILSESACACEYIQLDITDKEAVEKALTECKPDAVIHCAAWTAVDAAEDEENQENLDLAASFADLVQYADYNTGFMDLEAGAIDAQAIDVGVANYQLGERDGEYVILEETLSSEQSAIGFLKGNEELRDQVEETLSEMVEDGTFMEIAEKYSDFGLVDSVCLGK